MQYDEFIAQNRSIQYLLRMKKYKKICVCANIFIILHKFLRVCSKAIIWDAKTDLLWLNGCRKLKMRFEI